MLKLLVTWRGVDTILGTYKTIERIGLDAPIDATLADLRKRGAICAEILGVSL